MSQISIYFSDETAEWLRNHKEETGKSIAQIVREALVLYRESRHSESIYGNGGDGE